MAFWTKMGIIPADMGAFTLFLNSFKLSP